MNPEETYDNFEYRRDGGISFREFKNAAKELEPPLKGKAAKKVFKELDQDGDKKVTTAELFNALGGCETCKEEFSFEEEEDEEEEEEDEEDEEDEEEPEEP